MKKRREVHKSIDSIQIGRNDHVIVHKEFGNLNLLSKSKETDDSNGDHYMNSQSFPGNTLNALHKM